MCMNSLQIKTCIVTTGRADYGPLLPLIIKLINSKRYNIFIVPTGTHLSQAHGMTINEIKKDGFVVDHFVEMTQKHDSEHDICKAISKGLRGFSTIYHNIQPDIIIVLGDRYELWAACIPAVIHQIPIAHIHGGEATFGAIDDCIRHSITKISSLHFASIEQYAKRIIQMGEDPEKVFIVGALGIDNIKNIELMDYEELSNYTGVNFKKRIALMTFHPVTLDDRNLAVHQVRKVLNSLLQFDLLTLITMPNADPAGNLVFEEIQQYLQKYPVNFKFIKNLGQKAYLSAMKYAALMIGNSSSGIVESASFKLPVVNVGERQEGRLKPLNVIDSNYSEDAIIKAINQALSKEFILSISKLKNPYGDGFTSNRIVKILNSIDIKEKKQLIKKYFIDLD